jgi:hypothetical protein
MKYLSHYAAGKNNMNNLLILKKGLDFLKKMATIIISTREIRVLKQAELFFYTGGNYYDYQTVG